MPRRRRPPRAGALTDLPPLKILTQIAILQATYYLSAAILILFTVLVAGQKFHFDLIFDWRSLRGDTTVGWMLGLVWMLNSLISVIFLLLVVSRSKLIPDFALTIHLLHLMATILYTHALPTNVLWWMLQTASAALMTSLGVWTCQWRELQPINFGGNRRTTEEDSVQNQPDDVEAHASGSLRRSMIVHGNDGGGGGGGGGRSGVRDADRGDYELVEMKHVEEEGGGGDDDGDGDVLDSG